MTFRNSQAHDHCLHSLNNCLHIAMQALMTISRKIKNHLENFIVCWQYGFWAHNAAHILQVLFTLSLPWKFSPDMERFSVQAVSMSAHSTWSCAWIYPENGAQEAHFAQSYRVWNLFFACCHNRDNADVAEAGRTSTWSEQWLTISSWQCHVMICPTSSWVLSHIQGCVMCMVKVLSSNFFASQLHFCSGIQVSPKKPEEWWTSG